MTAAIFSVLLLAVVLVVATALPGGYAQTMVAVPTAVIALLTGLVPFAAAWTQVSAILPTLGFLAAVLLVAYLVDFDGVFDWLGHRLARAGQSGPRRSLVLCFVAASATTAVLSLDATVVLLTPVVFATADRLRMPVRPHAYACAHLANSASTLLPISNLTNLMVFSASGLTFSGFAALMALPWLVTIAVELLVFAWFFAPELRGGPVGDPGTGVPTPTLDLVVLGVMLAGCGVGSMIGVEPVWAVLAAVLILGTRALVARRTRVRDLLMATDPGLLVFVVGLVIVVTAMADHVLKEPLAAWLPHSASLPAMLAVAFVAAVLANAVNNLPATLLLLTALGPDPVVGLLLAALLGVNIGPNLTYPGSLATLLWRRVMLRLGARVSLCEFSLLGLLTVPAGLALAVSALWCGLQLAAQGA